jgi:hypothetical protein
MFRLQSFHMYGVIGTAIVVGMLSVWLSKKYKVKTIYGEKIEFHLKKFNKGQIIGGLTRMTRKAPSPQKRYMLFKPIQKFYTNAKPIYYFRTALCHYRSKLFGSERKKHHHNTERKKGPALKWTAVKTDQPQFSITLPGELKPYEEVNIYPKMTGFVKKIYVDRGSYVRKGQLLAQLEAPEIGAQYAARASSSSTAYQRFLFSKQSYLRLKEAARKEGAVATFELERAYAQ